ncbi:MAG: autotransporter outer membrane beta-barrel domain-containing protein [Cyclobacteriaceae bacterium]|nr:autotransporter outer membrane beta-barrel domain-containing protein [Cyclobacteriaceae bacterium]
MCWIRKPITLLCLLVGIHSGAQIADEGKGPDVIIRVDGVIVHAKVVSVDQAEVTYKLTEVADAAVITLPRKLVYAISYADQTTQVITPSFGRKRIDLLPFDADKRNVSADETDETDENNWRSNVKKGTIRVGLGFVRNYSSLDGVSNFKKTASSPSLSVMHQFRFNRLFVVGCSVGYAGFNYQYTSISDYDQIDINQRIRESITTLGFYGRYNLMDGFVRPYLLAGVNFNYSSATIDSDIFFRDEAKRISTHTGIQGFKTNLALRAGIDLHLSQRFGLYGDIGTGSSLIQIGTLFILD